MTEDPWRDLTEAIAVLIRTGEEALGFPRMDVPLELPAPQFGDLALPTHAYAKTARAPPPEIAAQFSEAMPPRGEYVSRHEPVAGYVNFHLDLGPFAEHTLGAILHASEDYGRSAPNGLRALVEHTSVNPTGPIHVGRARNSIIGDTLARLLDQTGYEVTREFLVNDSGRQVLTLLWGLDNLGEKDVEPPAREGEDYRLVRYYQKAMEAAKDPAVTEEVDGLVRRLEEGDEKLRRRVRAVTEQMMDGILRSLRRLDIAFDSLFWDDQVLADGSAQQVVERLRDGGHLEEEEGALYIDMAPHGFAGRNPRWFLTRRDGTTLYTTRDLAYHLDKFGRTDKALNVLGEDHRLEFQQLSVALRMLGVEQEAEAVFLAFVSLPEGRLSTRGGRVVNIDDLVDEAVERALVAVKARREDLSEEEMTRIAEAVGIGAVRYNIVKVQPEKRILFRWDQALSLEGQTAPFLQYAYARASGILGKAGGLDGWDARLLTHPHERALVKLLARYPGVLRDAAERRRPNRVALFGHELATTFNQFYRDAPVLQAEVGLRAARLALVTAYKTVLGNLLTCLGIQPLEEM
ncbi:MAG: arginine--tRNA ligase [Thermoplasmata archaeon]